MKILVPDKAERVAIGAILSQADDEIDVLKNKKTELEKQKKYLLKNLMTGTIRTPEHLIVMNKEIIHA
jgi:restriction endonuclease S subunit